MEGGEGFGLSEGALEKGGGGGFGRTIETAMVTGLPQATLPLDGRSYRPSRCHSAGSTRRPLCHSACSTRRPLCLSAAAPRRPVCYSDVLYFATLLAASVGHTTVPLYHSILAAPIGATLPLCWQYGTRRPLCHSAGSTVPVVHSVIRLSLFWQHPPATIMSPCWQHLLVTLLLQVAAPAGHSATLRLCWQHPGRATLPLCYSACSTRRPPATLLAVPNRPLCHSDTLLAHAGDSATLLVAPADHAPCHFLSLSLSLSLAAPTGHSAGRLAGHSAILLVVSTRRPAVTLSLSADSTYTPVPLCW